MESLEKIKKLQRNANSIYALFRQKIPMWRSKPKHYDKTGFGFNTDSRFRACEGVTIAFDSHMGTYGDSGCSSQCSLDKDIFSVHLLKYLNKNAETIMLAIADSIIDEALTHKEKAEQELIASLEQIQRLGIGSDAEHLTITEEK